MSLRIGLGILFFFNLVIGSAASYDVKYKLNKVTVFLTGAELFNSSKLELPEGNAMLILNNVSHDIDPKSIKATLSGNIKILSIVLSEDHITKEKYFKNIGDSIVYLNDRVEEMDLELEVLETEKQLFLSNISRIGNSGGVSAEELDEARQLYDIKLREINKEILVLRRQKKTFNRILLGYQEQLKLNTTVVESTKKSIEVKVHSYKKQVVELGLSYHVNKAGWAPKYDLRVKDNDEKFLIEYKANVFNDCGIDWSDVELILSTLNPVVSLERPELSDAWALSFSDQKGFNNEGNLSDKQLKKESEEIEYTSIHIPEEDINFNIPFNYTIPSDRKPYLVEVSSNELPFKYGYYAVPRIQDEVYLAANVKNWEKLNLIEGPTSIYRNGVYLGESYLDTKYSSEILTVSLGVDRMIQISRVKKLDEESEKTLGVNRVINLEYEIDVRNNHAKPVELVIEDQIPISQDSDIEIEVIDVSGAEHNEKNGKLKWTAKLNEGERKKYKVALEIVMPKSRYRKGIDLNLTGGLFTSSVKCPKFR